MEFPNIPTLKADAALALQKGREPRKVILAFAGIMTLVAAGLTVLSFWLGQQISNTGGLSNLGTRTMLSTAQMVLPLVQMVVLMSLELGYQHAMLRISRRQYADETDLKVGFRKFFPLLRLTLLQAVLYFAIGFLTYQVAMLFYMFSPWAGQLTDLILPLMEGGMADSAAVMSDAFLAQAAPLVIPMFLVWGALFLAGMIPVSYRLRFAQYALLDDSRGRALAAMNASVRMTRGNCKKIFKLDLSFWWYYLATGVLMGAYVAVVLLGLDLGFSFHSVFWLCCVLYALGSLALDVFAKPRIVAANVLIFRSATGKD